MFFRDLKNTYRDFLLVLLGIILLITLLDVFSLVVFFYRNQYDCC